MTESQTETTERADLSWLSDVKPTETTMRTSKRGRQPGKNPVASHVKAAHGSGKTLSLPVPAQHAKTTERMLRRAAIRENWSISVQVLDESPETATADNVVALKDVASLPEGTDVWVSFQVRDKDANESDESGNETDAPADPFAGTPSADAGEATDATPEPEDEPKSPRKGRRSAA